jgi:hypothetical protein
MATILGNCFTSGEFSVSFLWVYRTYRQHRQDPVNGYKPCFLDLAASSPSPKTIVSNLTCKATSYLGAAYGAIGASSKTAYVVAQDNNNYLQLVPLDGTTSTCFPFLSHIVVSTICIPLRDPSYIYILLTPAQPTRFLGRTPRCPTRPSRASSSATT